MASGSTPLASAQVQELLKQPAHSFFIADLSWWFKEVGMSSDNSAGGTIECIKP